MKFNNVFRIICKQVRTVRDRDSCWNWMGSLTTNGYPYTQYQSSKGRKHEHVQRVIWKFLFGQLTKYWAVCTSCENKLCCRPGHLYKDKKSDICLAHGVQLQDQPNSRTGTRLKLTPQQAHEIRYRRDKTYRGLAEEYGVSLSLVAQIKARIQWKRIEL